MIREDIKKIKRLSFLKEVNKLKKAGINVRILPADSTLFASYIYQLDEITVRDGNILDLLEEKLHFDQVKELKKAGLIAENDSIDSVYMTICEVSAVNYILHTIDSYCDTLNKIVDTRSKIDEKLLNEIFTMLEIRNNELERLVFYQALLYQHLKVLSVNELKRLRRLLKSELFKGADNVLEAVLGKKDLLVKQPYFYDFVFRLSL